MSLADLRKTILERNTLSASFFGEQVTFIPDGGAPRTICAKVKYRQAAPDRDGTVDEDEHLEVTVGLDEDNAVIGGLRDPQIGERLHRQPAADPDRRPWTFSGEKADVRQHSQVLVFSRARRVAQGHG